ncbi:hypothetical protein SFPGR_18600 [Sulfuriferula plumbiphila]|nr:hypothetical protein SFPGR_18600 [Sulfuriferula plumbiphila]
MPLRAVITEGTRADCAEADQLIEGFQMEHLLADKGYDSDAIVALPYKFAVLPFG